MSRSTADAAQSQHTLRNAYQWLQFAFGQSCLAMCAAKLQLWTTRLAVCSCMLLQVVSGRSGATSLLRRMGVRSATAAAGAAAAAAAGTRRSRRS